MEHLMSEAIVLTFTHNENEHIAATRWFYNRVYHTGFLLILSCLVVVLGVFSILLSANLIFGGVIAIAGLVFFIFNFYAYFVNPSQYFRRNSKFQEQYRLQFSEEGLLFHSKGVESKLEWSFYSKVFETQRFYFLLYDKDLFTLIPKRVFDNKDQELAFRDLLNRKIAANLGTRDLVGEEIGEYRHDSFPIQSPPDWR